MLTNHFKKIINLFGPVYTYSNGTINQLFYCSQITLPTFVAKSVKLNEFMNGSYLQYKRAQGS